ncbi:hypothetical protein SERLA73DRAFT_186254 [Serpula lacrymans var. lacrymans S7.3]|uniref:Uncharacterized protein n=2 Tax=Serpula lacrymans var. lacrymans TaxID=341189 RepID=F8Q5M1_SERL3|nr:uncharacterized protein SERLADRAFT_475200 [Serpula lacrymans var. lacrymans S7.9]EGN96492.1 hypothetical protein SERLA73DRAFT_186254 [Serpula lacrymans var. lacrymans S7.3]EGO22039.1 hypothetical protein SERLADRAFT_475200 [Serpula lacrymans var. lacrymans S7.9]
MQVRNGGNTFSYVVVPKIVIPCFSTLYYIFVFHSMSVTWDKLVSRIRKQRCSIVDRPYSELSRNKVCAFNEPILQRRGRTLSSPINNQTGRTVMSLSAWDVSASDQKVIAERNFYRP